MSRLAEKSDRGLVLALLAHTARCMAFGLGTLVAMPFLHMAVSMRLPGALDAVLNLESAWAQMGADGDALVAELHRRKEKHR